MKPISLHEFILHHAAFNQSLQKSILDKDLKSITQIIKLNYAEEIAEGVVNFEKLNIDRLHHDLTNQLKEENWDWAF